MPLGTPRASALAAPNAAMAEGEGAQWSDPISASLDAARRKGEAPDAFRRQAVRP
jgi:hypothetical protein